MGAVGVSSHCAPGVFTGYRARHSGLSLRRLPACRKADRQALMRGCRGQGETLRTGAQGPRTGAQGGETLGTGPREHQDQESEGGEAA